jgi:hypothetical protein
MCLFIVFLFKVLFQVFQSAMFQRVLFVQYLTFSLARHEVTVKIWGVQTTLFFLPRRMALLISLFPAFPFS